MTDIQVQVRARDERFPHIAEYAREKVGAALRRTSRPVLYARVWLDHAPDPAVARPAVAGVEIDLNGTVIRAHADAPTQVEAVDLMQDRLRARLTRVIHR